MNRVVAMAVLIVAVFFGYAAGGGRTEAQATVSASFPFGVGDNVRVLFEIEDRAGEPCIIDNFRGSFVICKSNSNGLQLAFNSRKVVKVTRIGSGQ
jgi:ribosomal protein L19